MKQFADPKLNQVLDKALSSDEHVMWTHEGSTAPKGYKSFAGSALFVGIVWALLITSMLIGALLGGGLRGQMHVFYVNFPIYLACTFGPLFFGVLLVRRLNKFACALTTRRILFTNAAWPKFSQSVHPEQIVSTTRFNEADRHFLRIDIPPFSNSLSDASPFSTPRIIGDAENLDDLESLIQTMLLNTESQNP